MLIVIPRQLRRAAFDSQHAMGNDLSELCRIRQDTETQGKPASILGLDAVTTRSPKTLRRCRLKFASMDRHCDRF